MAELTVGGADLAAPLGFGPDSIHFRNAMSRIAAAVHIVTTNGPAGLGGITVTSVTSITLDPAMMLFCINKASASVDRIVENGVFCINALTPAHQVLADIFAGRTDQRLEERFAGADWTKLATGSPALREAAASFDCRLVEAKEVGTHLIMIGLVEAVVYGPEGESLVYAHRRYRTL
ncbi:FMN reductase (NADH) RutF 2 [Methylocella tundrae]|uniref:FMN reductase (NADH) RutF 2 n=1 Tax=Methylocella tundrae TaxID=227605 RepID=A0A4V6IML7_METTU|nr:flavin reductase family protein [Methylocella tundrae]WPP06225.1 flavin reductase family protein [Methylocella tundrae]VFU08893.1 FMN reductase (NADH) RutF 2 [Methylocella tundrae]VTZ28195.1 FMN reductase (NADH) RutF 2 [Methylocella tundrae]VTZ51717.1 FMN reductase (NADH) RutF 2 [Methylocella tundrae]